MLPIQLSGNGVEITQVLRDFINKKFEHLRKHSARITSVRVFLTINKNKVMQHAEATIHIPGFEIFADASSEDMYKTIDLLEAKLLHQLDKHKDKIVGKRKRAKIKQH